ncbi:MAG TPA: hypothetical protein VFU68_04965 [Terracidiphilus sp.]|nr:hypothetical protein [Terracidiphilus sp.]
MDSERGPRGGANGLGAWRSAVVWGVLFCACFTLGYPTLNRYDARELGPDWKVYYAAVQHKEDPTDFPFAARVLVPAVARPFAAMAQGRLGTWDAVWFGLLVANSLFVASAAWVLLQMGLRVTGDAALALLGCTLYLLNFVVADLWLSGMVDGAEALLLLLVAWALLEDRWWWLPLIGIAGGMAKQSFLPLAVVFAGAWWMATERKKRKPMRLAWVAGLGATSMAAMMLTQRAETGTMIWPWTVGAAWSGGREGDGFLLNLLHCFADHRFWYGFVWLLPVGVWRLKRLPRRWVAASLATGAAAAVLAAYGNIGGSLNRPLFEAVGPVLTVSAAMLLGEERSAEE